MLIILKARGKSCVNLPDGLYSGHVLNRMCVSCREHTEKDDSSVTCCLYHVLSNEPDFKSQKSWLSETLDKYPGCQLIFYAKFHCELSFIEMVWAKAHDCSKCTCSLIPYYMYMYITYIYIYMLYGIQDPGP